MATTLGYTSYDPSGDVAYRESIVSGIQSMGAEVQKQLRGITEKKQLDALGQELQTVDPASPDFAHRMGGLVVKYPVAASSPSGTMAINLLGRSHEQLLRQQTALSRGGGRAVAPGYDPSTYQRPTGGTVETANSVIEAPLPNGEEVVQDEAAFFMEPSPVARMGANATKTPDFSLNPLTSSEPSTPDGPPGAKGPYGVVEPPLPVAEGHPEVVLREDAPKALTPEQKGQQAYDAVRTDPATRNMKPGEVLRAAETARNNAERNARVDQRLVKNNDPNKVTASRWTLGDNGVPYPLGSDGKPMQPIPEGVKLSFSGSFPSKSAAKDISPAAVKMSADDRKGYTKDLKDVLALKDNYEAMEVAYDEKTKSGFKSFFGVSHKKVDEAKAAYEKAQKNFNQVWIDRFPEIRKLTEQAVASTQGKTLDAETATALFKEVGGDKEKARALARERGYTF